MEQKSNFKEQPVKLLDIIWEDDFVPKRKQRLIAEEVGVWLDIDWLELWPRMAILETFHRPEQKNQPLNRQPRVPSTNQALSFLQAWTIKSLPDFTTSSICF